MVDRYRVNIHINGLYVIPLFDPTGKLIRLPIIAVHLALRGSCHVDLSLVVYEPHYDQERDQKGQSDLAVVKLHPPILASRENGLLLQSLTCSPLRESRQCLTRPFPRPYNTRRA